jgi:hypothetical protein
MSALLDDARIAQILSQDPPRVDPARLPRLTQHLYRIEHTMQRISARSGYIGRPALWARHERRLAHAFHLSRALPARDARPAPLGVVILA